MRQLAQRLEVAPNALYGYVRNKADLIDGIVDDVYAGLELEPAEGGDWIDQLVHLSQSLREHLLAILRSCPSRCSSQASGHMPCV
jgi:AcrR family transcriptional regulator